MALVVKDRVQETTTTTGTGTLTLNGAVFGFQTFAIIGDGNVTYYAITDPGTGSWEVGIGTYTASGTTLSRTTVLESSNSGSLVNFAAGTKNVFCTYPAERAVYLDTAGSAVTLLDIGTLGASTANITTANITSGTITTTPVNNTDIVNKEYADAIASGIHFHEAVGYATTAALPACTYNNGTSGVGATLTGDSNGALTIDGHTFTSPTDDGTRVLIKNQANGAHNGVYTLTQAGNSSPGAPFILTRSTDMDTVGTGVDQIDEGDFFLVTSGTANVNTAWVQQTAPPITIGTTAIVFQQFSAPITYTAGTGLSESPTYTFNIANTGTAGTYGSASNVPVFVTNAQGQVTSVTNTGIAIASGAVSGLAASATTDTTNASNITTGTLGTSRLSGSYTGITGTGALAAGSLATGFTAVSAPLGGTGQTSYAVGDLLYASTTTALSKLADVAVGNALISGGVGVAPSYGKIGLATHVSGTLPIANGGTNSTATPTNGGVVYGTGTAQAYSTAGTSGQVLTSAGAAAPTWTTATNANTASAIVKRDASGNFSAGTITAALSGNASTATSATTATSASTSTTQAKSDASTNIATTAFAKQLFYSPSTGGTLDWDDVSNTRPGAGQTLLLGSATNGPGGGNYYIPFNYEYSSFDGTGNVTQTAIAYGTPANELWMRGRYLGTWSSWVRYLNSSNYNSYSPTLTGTGASGTWGINITGNAATATNGIPAGTVMLFAQTAAPTGWTKSTAHDNKALRVVSGTASSGGTVAFTTAFASKSVSGSLSNTTATNQAQTATNQAQTQGGTVGSTTLDTTQIPSHRHTVPTGSSTLDGVYVHEARVAYGSENTSFVGGGLSHNHTFSGSSHNHTQNSHNHTQDAHTHTFTGTAIDLAVQYVDVIIATKN
jgi:hypothetical protein